MVVQSRQVFAGAVGRGGLLGCRLLAMLGAPAVGVEAAMEVELLGPQLVLPFGTGVAELQSRLLLEIEIVAVDVQTLVVEALSSLFRFTGHGDVKLLDAAGRLQRARSRADLR